MDVYRSIDHLPAFPFRSRLSPTCSPPHSPAQLSLIILQQFLSLPTYCAICFYSQFFFFVKTPFFSDKVITYVIKSIEEDPSRTMKTLYIRGEFGRKSFWGHILKEATVQSNDLPLDLVFQLRTLLSLISGTHQLSCPLQASCHTK